MKVAHLVDSDARGLLNVSVNVAVRLNGCESAGVGLSTESVISVGVKTKRSKTLLVTDGYKLVPAKEA